MLFRGSTTATRVSQTSWQPSISQLLITYVLVLSVSTWAITALDPLHHDMTEAWAWGQSFQWGYHKHPPLFAWVTGAWFYMFPRTEISFYVLAASSAAVGLAGIWKVSQRFLPASQAFLPIYLTLLTPAFTLHAVRYNANSALLAVWPWAIYALVRAFDERSARSGAFLGAMLAAAVLTKYYSVVLLAVCAGAVALHPSGVLLLRSRACVTALLVGTALLIPHAMWMLDTGYQTFAYAASKMRYDKQFTLFMSGLSVIAAILSLVFVAVGAVVLNLRPLRQAVVTRNNAWILWLGVGPMIVSIIFAGVTSVQLSTHFLIPSFCFLPVAVVTLCRRYIHGMRQERLVLLCAIVWAVGILGHGAVTAYRYVINDAPGHWRREIARVVENAWHKQTAKPLRIVGGNMGIATSLAFYGSNDIVTWDAASPHATPWVRYGHLKEHGFAIVCETSDTACRSAIDRFHYGRAELFALTAPSSASRHSGARTTFLVLMMPPRPL